jgi:hypothetical protein
MQNVTITDTITGETFTGNRVDGAEWIRNQFKFDGTSIDAPVDAFADLVERSADLPDDGWELGLTVEVRLQSHLA